MTHSRKLGGAVPRCFLMGALALLGGSSACGRIWYDPQAIDGGPQDTASETGDSSAGGSGGTSGAAGRSGAGGTAGAGGLAGSGGVSSAAGAGGAASAGSTGMSSSGGTGAGATGGGGAASGGAASGGAGGAASASGGASGGAGGAKGGAGGAGGAASASGGAGGAGASGGAGGAGGAATLPNCLNKTFGGKTYLMCSPEITWTAAHDSCASVGMTLVRIDSAAENQWLFDNVYDVAMPSSSMWIGADDQAVEGAWRWPDGVLFWLGDGGGAAQGGLYNNWFPASPGSSQLNRCAAMDLGASKGGGWFNARCASLFVYACEAP